MRVFCSSVRTSVVGSRFCSSSSNDNEVTRSTEQTVTLLERAVRELEHCSRVLNAIGSNSPHVMKVYRVVHDHLRATLNLAEVEMDLQRPDEAGFQLDSSTKLMTTLKKKARSAGLDVSAVNSLNRRLEEAYDRHKRIQGIASAASEPLARGTQRFAHERAKMEQPTSAIGRCPISVTLRGASERGRLSVPRTLHDRPDHRDLGWPQGRRDAGRDALPSRWLGVPLPLG